MPNVEGSHRVKSTPEWAGPAWSRLRQQIAWYEGQSMRAMAFYKTIKILQLVAGATVPVVAGFGVSGWVTGILGSAIVVMEGIQQLFRYHEYWLSYRAACEALRREMWLFEAKGGIYGGAKEPDALLAERLHEITSQESARWAAIHTEDERDAS